jgi:hypothetical protein
VEDEDGERDREGPQEEELTTSQPRESGEKNPSKARSKRRHQGLIVISRLPLLTP